MVDIFTAVLSVSVVCALFGTFIKMLLIPQKVWDEDYNEYEQIDPSINYKELRQENPHIWMD